MHLTIGRDALSLPCIGIRERDSGSPFPFARLRGSNLRFRLSDASRR